MADYEQYLAHVARAEAEREAKQLAAAAQALDALTPEALALAQKQQVLQAASQLRTQATTVLVAVQEAEKAGVPVADVKPLRAAHDAAQLKATQRIAAVEKPVA